MAGQKDTSIIPYDTTQRNVSLDEFITPPALIQACLSTLWFDKDETYTVLDPGCNKGQWGEELKKLYPNIVLVGVERMDVPRNPAYDVWIPNQDFLTWTFDVKFDFVVGNPPYSTTKPDGKRQVIVNHWIKHTLELVSETGYWFYLLRKGFNHNLRAWKVIFNEHPPMQEYMLIPRPNFFGIHDVRTKGDSGARWDYSWVVGRKYERNPMRSVPLFWKGK